MSDGPESLNFLCACYRFERLWHQADRLFIMRGILNAVRQFFIIATIASAVLASANAEDDILSVIEEPAYQAAPFNERLATLDAWLAGRPSDLRDQGWAMAVTQRLIVLVQQGDFTAAEITVDAELKEALPLLDGSSAYVDAVYAAGFVKTYAQRVDQALQWADKIKRHPEFDGNPLYAQYADNLMVAIHNLTGNPILAGEIMVKKYEEGDANRLPLIEELKLLVNAGYTFIVGGEFDRGLHYLDLGTEKLAAAAASGDITPIDLRRMRWHMNSSRALVLMQRDEFLELKSLVPSLEDDASAVGAPLYDAHTDFVKAGALFGEGLTLEADDLLAYAIERTVDLKSPDVLLSMYDLQTKIKNTMGDPQAALDAHLAGREIEVAQKAFQTRARIAYRETQESLERQNEQILKLESENRLAAAQRRRDQAIVIVALASFVIVFLFSIALMLSQRRLRLYADELENSEQEAQIAAKAKSAFLANMSHEIRTPLNGLLGMAQVLSQKEVTAESRECVDVILSSGTSLLKIVNDVLDLSKIEAGKMSIAASPTEVADIAAKVENLWKASAESKGLQFSVSVSKGVPAGVMVDWSRLHQCVSNLVSNAIKFTEHGEISVVITTDDHKDNLVVAVRDTGLGIQSQAQEQLFSAFEQADTSTTRRFGGTGLGLAIVERFTKLMGGRVELESVYGQGSVFSIYVPLRPVSTGALTCKQPQTHAAPIVEALSNIETVLLVDDNAVNRMVVRAFLKDSGVRIVEASNGREAVDYLRDVGDADLVLLDMHMPVMDGPEAIDRIRSLDGTARHVPIVVLTADAMEGDRERYLQLSVQSYVAKPVVRAELWAEMQRLDSIIRDDEAWRQLPT